jgi:hypothetical protein
MRRYLFNANHVDTSVIKIPIRIKEAISSNNTCQVNVISIVSITLFSAKKTVMSKHRATMAEIKP